MKRVVILGPGASGKSTFARRLSGVTGLPVTELDKIFWRSGLVPTPPDEWAKIQQALVQEHEWILDGDLGPYDAVEARLRAADTIIFLDISLARCAWRALQRSSERLDFWLWLFRYRHRSRPFLMATIAEFASDAKVHVLTNPKAAEEFLRALRRL